VISPKLESVLLLSEIFPPIVNTSNLRLFVIEDALDDFWSNKRPVIAVEQAVHTGSYRSTEIVK
jgi:hypothetical protein